jgi:hypothetical protein
MGYKRAMADELPPSARLPDARDQVPTDDDPPRPPLRPRVSNGPKPIATSSILDKVLRRAGLTDQARRLAVVRVWAQVVGRDISARTTPVSFSRGTLIVKASSSAWQNELTFLGPSIKAALNEKLGRRMVRTLKVVAGQSAPPAQRTEAPRIEPSRAQVLAAEEAAATITDPELRRAFERLSAVGMAAAQDSSRNRRRTSSE